MSRLIGSRRERLLLVALCMTAAFAVGRLALADWRASVAAGRLERVLDSRAGAQREALALLASYAKTGSARDLQGFESAIARTEALGSVRFLLRQPETNERAFAEALLAAGSDPVAVAEFVEGVPSLRTVAELDLVLRLWDATERQIADARALADRTSSEAVAPRPAAPDRLVQAISSAGAKLQRAMSNLQQVVVSARERLRRRAAGRGFAAGLVLVCGMVPLSMLVRWRRADAATVDGGVLDPRYGSSGEQSAVRRPGGNGPAGSLLPGCDGDGGDPSAGDPGDLLRQLPVTIWTTDRELRYTSVSGPRVPGVTPVVGIPVLDSYDPRTRPIGALRAHQQALAGDACVYEHELEGRIYRCEVSPWKTGADTVVGTLGVAVDITEYKHGAVRFEELAHVDPLTNLSNRRRFEEQLSNALADCARTGVGGALVWCDLDHFKSINDSLGHRTGDLFLRRVADAFRVHVRRGDTLARLGGDEFGLLLRGASVEDATPIAKRMLDSVGRETAAIKTYGLRTTASIGIVAFPQHGTTTEELLTRADVAMYQAKSRGRGFVEVFSHDEHLVPLLSRIHTAEQARLCLEQDRMELHLEPICDLGTLAVSRYEALLRMPDEHGEPMRPDHFLEICESFGMSRDIDHWVIRKTCQLLRRFRSHGVNIPIEINLSGSVFGEESTLRLIDDQMRSGDINPGSLIFEVPERVAVADLERASAFIDELRRLGCQFAIDDFGAGFSSFGYLRRLRVRYLKIDGSFVRGLHSDPVNQNLVRAIIEMSRSLGITPVAEFVDDARTAAWLLAESCRYGQGAYTGLARPVHEVLVERADALASRWQAADRIRASMDQVVGTG